MSKHFLEDPCLLKKWEASNTSYLEMAYPDFVKAAKIEQNNKDIIKELRVTRNSFFFEAKGSGEVLKYVIGTTREKRWML